MRSFLIGLCAAAFSCAAAAADLPQIKARGELVAATSGNLVPVTYVDESGKLQGYDIEVAHYIEKKIGVKIRLVRLDWSGILAGLQAGRFDAVFSNVNITPQRKEVFEYSIPYSRSAVVPVVRNGLDAVHSFKDLKGLNVGAIAGSNDGEVPAHKIEAQYGAFKSYKGYTGNAELFADLAIGRIDVAVAPDTAAAYFLKSHTGIGHIVGPPFQVAYVGIPMQKGSPQLAAAFDAAIREMQHEGLLDKWGEKFFGIEHYSAQLIDHVP